jgi:hypothetical protein
MNQKAFAIFVGAIMIISAFAGFVLRGSNQNETIVVSNPDSLQTFGVQGRLVDWNFEGLKDVMEMSPESTVMAYWINLTRSQNLTDSAQAALPQSFGLTYGPQLYPNKIERLSEIYFNNTWMEFHWVQPFPVGSIGLVVPYQDYMMIPIASSSDYMKVMGQPTLFGSQEATKQTIDVISGSQPAGNFTLVDDAQADLQVAALGSGGASMPLSGGYKEFYLGVSVSKDRASGFDLYAKYQLPSGSANQRVSDIAKKNNLSYSMIGSDAELSGFVVKENLRNVLVGLLAP